MHYITDEKDSIFQIILKYFIQLSQTEKGLNVIKEFVVCLKSTTAQHLIAKKVIEIDIPYIEHGYSNYAFQLMISKWPCDVTAPLFAMIKGNVARLCNQKCSSNVMEAVFSCSPTELFEIFLKEILCSFKGI